ncbi:MAG TPA: TonB-dependent receptor [Thermoanaerobaculia bacterium]|jgi:iron complex outermembrane receptor protein
MKTLVTRTAIAAVVLSLGLPTLPLLAQQTPKKDDKTPSAQEEKKPKVTEEMVVTARKREETVEEVPISIAAPTESELRDRGAETIEDIAANVAGFSVQNLGPGQSQVAMRGVSSGQIVRDQPGVKEQVGVYLDESVISMSLFTPDIDLFDLNRVEVLRGPQGTLFGSGSESGTLRYITNAPKIGLHETVAELSADSINGGGTGGSLKFALNSPFGTTSALRLVGYYTSYGGYIDAVQPNLSTNKDVNDGYRAGARLAYLYKPSDQLSITPRLLYQKVNMHGWNRADIFNILANPFTTTRPKVTLGNYEQFTQFEEPFNDKFLLGDVNVTYNLGGSTLTSITSYTNRDVDVLRDATALTASITGGTIPLTPNIYTLDAPLDDATKAHGYTEELRLAGGVGKTQWVVGGFYSSSRRNYGQQLLVKGFTALSGIPTAGKAIAPTDGLFWSDLRYKDRQSALFGEATFSVTPKLDVTGGLRWYDYSESRTQIFDGIFGEDNDGNPQIQPGSASANGIAPRIMASYKLSEATRLNAQISKGFRLGGINDPLNVSLCTPADLVTFGGHDAWNDETLWNYEVGSKSKIAGGRGSLNVAAFYMDIKDLQATVTAGTCSSRLVFNVPKARSAGAEVEFQLAPTDNFDFAVSATKTDSKLRSTVTSTDDKGNVTVVAGIRSGDRMPSVPEEQLAAAATLRWPVRTWVGYATGVYQHIGDRYTQVGDEDLGNPAVVDLLTFTGTIGGPLTQGTFTFDPKLPAYDLVNFRIGLLYGRWDTALFVNNVTNERALLSLDRERGLRARVSYLTNQPRTIGISSRVTF